jgi:hypothetical protein
VTTEAYDSGLQAKWRKDVGVPLRSPRVGYEEVVQAVINSWPPTVFMRESNKTTDIVIRIPWSSKRLSDAHRGAYFGHAVPLPRVFSDILSTTASKGENRFETKLANTAYQAYKLMWIRFFRSLYQDQFDPRINPPKWLAEIETIFNSKKDKGRREKDDAKRLQNRFELLVSCCEDLHGRIAHYNKNKNVHDGNRRFDILRTFWKEIQKIPGGISILGGEAFLKIPRTKLFNKPRFEDTTSWEPRQLGIALLALELQQDYHTIERKFPRRRRGKP